MNDAVGAGNIVDLVATIRTIAAQRDELSDMLDLAQREASVVDSNHAAEVANIEAENARLRERDEWAMSEFKRWGAIETQRARLWAAFRKYGEHKMECAVNAPTEVDALPLSCSCGFANEWVGIFLRGGTDAK